MSDSMTTNTETSDQKRRRLQALEETELIVDQKITRLTTHKESIRAQIVQVTGELAAL
jgi:hypothetical protein